MFNNFTAEKEYQCCNIIVEPSQNRGPLLIGDFNSATDPQIHTKYNINTVITAAAGLQHLQIPNTVSHIVYPLKDAKTQNIRTYFEQSNKTIGEKLKQGGVLVHCAAGVSRSATLVIAYLMKNNQLTFKAAIQLVKKNRSGICPNLGFQLQLKQYEKQLFGPPSLAIRKNISEKLSQSYQFSEQITPFNSASNRSKKIQNYSLFNFQPVSNYKSVITKKVDPKKTSSKAFGHSKPKQKIMVNVSETQLFVSGKAAKRPASQVKESQASKKGMKHAMMETWGISGIKGKQF